LSDSRQNYNIFSVFIDHTLSRLNESNDRCTHEIHMELHANIEFGERQHVVESIIDAVRSERPGDRGGQDPTVENIWRRHRNVFTKLPPFRPFAILVSRSFFVSFRESMSWPSSIITVSSPWCRRRCASSPLLRDHSLAFYVLKEKHNMVACAD